MRYWKEHFLLEKEGFTNVPAWIRLYYLPYEYWNEGILEGIENVFGHFVKVSESTKIGHYSAYARICVYMDILNLILANITLSLHD